MRQHTQFVLNHVPKEQASSISSKSARHRSAEILDRRGMMNLHEAFAYCADSSVMYTRLGKAFNQTKHPTGQNLYLDA